MNPLVLYLNQGDGERLRDLTADKPKSMLEINGRYLCDYFFDCLGDRSIDIIMATKKGGKHEPSNVYFTQRAEHGSRNIKIKPVNFLTKKAYASVFFLMGFMRREGYDSLVVFPNDVFYEGGLLDLLDLHYQERSDLTILAAPDPQPELATMKFRVENNRIVSLQKGKPEPEESIRLAVEIYDPEFLSGFPGFLFNLFRGAPVFFKGNPVTHLFERYRIHLVRPQKYCMNINNIEDYQAVYNYLSK